MRILTNYLRSTLINDVLAGLTGAVAGAPQSMGFAILGGVSPVYGLYASIVPTILGSITSASTLITIAPTNVLMLLVAGALVTVGNPDPPYALFTFTLLVGAFQLIFGVLRLGNLTRFISNSVVVGFIAGAAILIIEGQLHHITGYHVPASSNALYKFEQWLQRLPETHGQTLVIGLITIVTILVLHHTRFKNVATLTAILATTVLVHLAGWDSVQLVRHISSIPAGLPTPAFPDLEVAPLLLSAALATALLASVQSAALAEKLRDRSNATPDINRDFIAQGVANVAGSLVQCLPSSASLSRTAVNISAGARTRMSNVYAGISVFLIIVFFNRLLESIPLASLAGHLVVAALSLIDRKAIHMVWGVNTPARVTMTATFLSTLVLPLEYSIYIGVAFSSFFYLYNSANNMEVAQLVRTGQNRYIAQQPPKTLLSRQPIVLSVRGSLYFGAVSRLEKMLPAPDGAQQPVVILRLREATSLGSTGIRFLLRYDQQLRSHGGKLILAGVTPEIQHEMEHCLTARLLEPDAIFPAQPVIFEATNQALDYAAAWLGEFSGSQGKAVTDVEQPPDVSWVAGESKG